MFHRTGYASLPAEGIRAEKLPLPIFVLHLDDRTERTSAANHMAASGRRHDLVSPPARGHLGSKNIDRTTSDSISHVICE